MARGINKVTLVGNLGADPDLRSMPNGNAVASMSIATGETWKDRQTGEQRSRTEWHRVVIFGKPAEIAGQYLRKGSKVYIEGNLRTRKWQDQSGQDRYVTEVVVSLGGQMLILDAPNQGQGQTAGTQHQAPSQQYAHQPSLSAHPEDPRPSPGGNFDDFDDDIPF